MADPIMHPLKETLVTLICVMLGVAVLVTSIVTVLHYLDPPSKVVCVEWYDDSHLDSKGVVVHHPHCDHWAEEK